jgi:hypothetical protein
VSDVGSNLGRVLIAAGVVLVAVGVLFLIAKPLRLGALPGDFTISGRGWRIAIPLATSLLLSAVLTIIVNLVARRR